MIKKSIIAIVAVFIAWTVMDFVIHGVLLKDTYAATAQLWRPMAEMKMGIMKLVTFVASICFVGIYACIVNPKNMGVALRYGFLFGLANGISAGFGTYATMPFPLGLAWAWLAAIVAECLVAAVLLGLIVKPPPAAL